MTEAPQQLNFRLDQIIETLVEHGADFVLVGGSAAWLYGASRPTSDADVVVDFGEANLWKVAAALDELNWRYRIEGLSDEESMIATAGQRMDPRRLRGGSSHTLMTDAGPVDILQAIPTRDGAEPGRDYAALRSRAVRVPVILGLTVRLAALDDIIESKQWADRPKDRQALPELIELQGQCAESTDNE